MPGSLWDLRVAVLLKRSFPFTVLGSLSGSLGRYVAIWGLLDGVAYNFVCIYVPPQMHTATFRDLGKIILDLPAGVTVIGGDCNAMLDRGLNFSRRAGDRVQMADARLRAWLSSSSLRSEERRCRERV